MTMLAIAFATLMLQGGAPDVELAGVRWHADLLRARMAAEAAGKPMLVLHMMGRLDDEFC